MQSEITLDGQAVTLVRSSRAAQKLSQKYRGGLPPLIEALRRGSISAVTTVLFYALARKDAERPELEAQAYRTGIVQLMPPLVAYVESLMAGATNDLANPWSI